MAPEHALIARNVSYRFGDSVAIDDLSLEINTGEIFGLLGPNGSGKSTFFRLIATLVSIQKGTIEICGHDVARDTNTVRRMLGVVFQSPSLDRKLTVLENIRCQAALYGIGGVAGAKRIDEVVEQMGLGDRLSDRCEKLSGGLKRRVELAKGLLHKPRLLILDEPSTGLDPAARLDLWQALVTLRNESKTTIVLTTHLLDEADKCDRIAILNRGRRVALDSPEQLRAETGQTVISIATNEPERVASVLKERFGWDAQVLDSQVRVMVADGKQILSQVIDVTSDSALSVTIGRPSLEDVFVKKTGHRFHEG